MSVENKTEYPLLMMCIAAKDLIHLGKLAISETATEHDREMFLKQSERTKQLVEKITEQS